MIRAVILSGAMVAAAALTAGEAEAKGGFGGKHHRANVTFEQLDANGDGQVTKEEMAAHATAHFGEVDTDGDGKLSAEELTAATEANRAKRIAKMIERHDENGDGMLDQAEMMPKGDRAERMFARLDANEDGMISAEEFAKMERHGHRKGMGKGKGDNN
ncbi:EF-hand domain-containing protein [Cognatishimia maritima]|uniref:Ca2+-binding protein, EF-hand superfamily n=1 Tax=Cognatishimia maritima TaxID=870908 RepID=A0A1M5UCS2_9RHOB|nr:EF-hand domain-containing protein [Cognatishimia maritima]SHH60834.1 Ca2+-binding protein, EF-hand superfamily [Cognatishimia maritima]